MLLPLFLLLLVLACCAASSRAALPSSPPAFLARPVTPVYAWSFRQSECVAGQVAEDINALLGLRRGALTSCPVRQDVSGTPYPGAIIGVNAVNGPNDALVSIPIGSRLSALNATVAWTFEAFFTKRAALSSTNHFLAEIGTNDTNPTQGNGGNGLGNVQSLLIFLDTGNSNFRIGTRFRLGLSVSSISVPVAMSGSVFNELLGSNGIGTTFHFAVSWGFGAGGVNVYLSKVGSSFQSSFAGDMFVSYTQNFFNPSHVLRLASTMSTASADSGFPADIHFAVRSK